MFLMPIAPVAAIMTHRIMFIMRKTQTRQGFAPVAVIPLVAAHPGVSPSRSRPPRWLARWPRIHHRYGPEKWTSPPLRT